MRGRAEPSPDGTLKIWWSPRCTEVEELRLQNKQTNNKKADGQVWLKDIKQQTGDVCDAVAVFSQVSVSLCRIEALQQT